LCSGNFRLREGKKALLFSTGLLKSFTITGLVEVNLKMESFLNWLNDFWPNHSVNQTTASLRAAASGYVQRWAN